MFHTGLRGTQSKPHPAGQSRGSLRPERPRSSRPLSLSFPFPSLSRAGLPGHGAGTAGAAGAVLQRRLPGAGRAAAEAAGPALGRAAGGRAAGRAALHAGAAARPGGGGRGRGARGGGHQSCAAVPGARRGLPGALRAAAHLQVPPEGLLPQPGGQVRGGGGGGRHRGGSALGTECPLRGRSSQGRPCSPLRVGDAHCPPPFISFVQVLLQRRQTQAVVSQLWVAALPLRLIALALPSLPVCRAGPGES